MLLSAPLSEASSGTPQQLVNRRVARNEMTRAKPTKIVLTSLPCDVQSQYAHRNNAHLSMSRCGDKLYPGPGYLYDGFRAQLSQLLSVRWHDFGTTSTNPRPIHISIVHNRWWSQAEDVLAASPWQLKRTSFNIRGPCQCTQMHHVSNWPVQKGID